MDKVKIELNDMHREAALLAVVKAQALSVEAFANVHECYCMRSQCKELVNKLNRGGKTITLPYHLVDALENALILTNDGNHSSQGLLMNIQPKMYR